MGFRFKKTIKIAPGLRLNVSKSGVSASVGRPGATVNVGGRGARATVGIPGTGMSYSERVGVGKNAARGIVILLVVLALLAWYFFR